MGSGNYYEKIREDFDREATNPAGIFSKEWTHADYKIFNYLKEIVKPDWKVIEMACGMGNIIETLDCYQYGIDISEKMLEKANIIHKWAISFDDTHFEDKEFDLAFICFGLQQSEDPEKTLKEAERIAKKVIIFDGDRESSIGQERERRMIAGDWPTVGKAKWFDKNFFNKLGYETDNILPHVLVATK